MAPLCKFWARGECKYGNQCRFDHPPREGGFRNDNRFAALQPPEHSSGGTFGRSQNDAPIRSVYSLSREGVVGDLTTELPQWILSAYGPGLRAPTQLFGGPDREQSFEEVRLRHYEAHALGNPTLARNYEDDLVLKAKLQVQNALSDVDGAIEYVRKAENEHPNRIDICEAGSVRRNMSSGELAQQNLPGPALNPFASSTVQPAQTSSMFGKPTVLGQRQNPFGPPQLTVGAQASAGARGFETYGSRPNLFGPSQTQAPASNPFAPKTQATDVNPFAQPVQQPTSNPFAPKPASSPNPFAPPAGQPTSNPFGPNSPAQAPPNPFAPNTLSQAAQLQFASNPAAQLAANPFASEAPNPFNAQNSTAQASSAAVNLQAIPQTPKDPFRRQSGTTTSTGNGFNPFAPRPDPNTIGHPTTHGTNTKNTQQQNRPSSSSGNDPYPPNSEFQHPPLHSYASQDNQRLTTFKGKPVIYHEEEAGFKKSDGTWEKIWFPNGAPGYYKDTELPNEAYDEATKAAYLHLREQGSFDGFVMPLLPPKREWCMWNF